MSVKGLILTGLGHHGVSVPYIRACPELYSVNRAQTGSETLGTFSLPPGASSGQEGPPGEQQPAFHAEEVKGAVKGRQGADSSRCVFLFNEK